MVDVERRSGRRCDAKMASGVGEHYCVSSLRVYDRRPVIADFGRRPLVNFVFRCTSAGRAILGAYGGDLSPVEAAQELRRADFGGHYVSEEVSLLPTHDGASRALKRLLPRRDLGINQGYQERGGLIAVPLLVGFQP